MSADPNVISNLLLNGASQQIPIYFVRRIIAMDKVLPNYILVGGRAFQA